jgi:chromate transporter
MTPTFAEAFRVWLRIGCLSFGGPAGQIALMHKELVDQRKWIADQEFLRALSFCMFLPGPEAMQLATYVGWRMHGLKGALTAGILFVLPGALVILLLSLLYATLGNQPFVAAMFWGVKAAVLAIVMEALLRITKKALKSNVDWAIAAVAFLALFAFNIPFPVVVAVAGLIGFFMPGQPVAQAASAWPDHRQTLKTTAAWLAAWLIPLGAIVALMQASIHAELAIFFSKLAVVTFGGAYAVLAYMGQHVVEGTGWLTAAEMMDGLALAETTPGPLILVGQYVAFLAAVKTEGSLWAGLGASLVYLWMTFVPCFLWIMVGAPYIDHLGKMPRLTSALAKITAAVAGVILNLTVWFGLHVLFTGVNRLSGPVPIWKPDWVTLDIAALVLSLACGLALLRWHWGIPKTLGAAAAAGVIWKLIIQGL